MSKESTKWCWIVENSFMTTDYLDHQAFLNFSDFFEPKLFQNGPFWPIPGPPSIIHTWISLSLRATFDLSKRTGHRSPAFLLIDYTSLQDILHHFTTPHWPKDYLRHQKIWLSDLPTWQDEALTVNQRPLRHRLRRAPSVGQLCPARNILEGCLTAPNLKSI